ncbi:hypothetical protein FRC18_007333, partial [Serendipita sp. 400]
NEEGGRRFLERRRPEDSGKAQGVGSSSGQLYRRVLVRIISLTFGPSRSCPQSILRP